MAYSSITKPGDHFNTKLYSGNSSTNAITGVGFQPDLVWLKRRTVSVAHHLWHDIVRGKSGAKYYYLESSSTIAQNVQGDADGLSTLDSDGFTLTYNDSGAWNVSGSNYVSWNFKAGGTPSNNTDGDVTSSVSVNQTAGFSIATVSNLNSNSFGHGLGVEPHLIVNKRTDGVANWRVYYKGIASGKSLFLNTTAVPTTESSAIASATSSTVTVTGSGNGGTGGTGDTVYYCFAPIKGFSKIGTYVGNGNSNGTFVYTGFKPAWVMMKNLTATANWLVFDTTRDSFNESGDTSQRLEANNTDIEDNGNSINLFSNGFKMKNTGVGNNTNGSSYLYLAFAENPLVANVSGGIPATAR